MLSLSRIRILGGGASLAALLCGLPFSGGSAADVKLDAALDETFRYDSNAFLSDAAPAETALWVTSPSLAITGEGPRSRTAFSTNFNIGRYTSNAGVDYENAWASLTHDYSGLRSKIGLALSTDYQTTQETEETDTGFFVADGYRFGYGIAPTFSYDVTQRAQISLDGAWRKVDYIDAAALEDYHTYSGGLGFNYLVTQLDRLGLRAGYRKFENDDTAGNESETYSGQLVWHRDVAERLSTRLLIGPRFTRQTTPVNVETESWGVDLEFNLDWRASEVTDMAVAASRTISGSGRGNAVQRDQANFGISHRALQFLTLDLDALYQHDEDPQNDNLVDRDFVSVSPSLRWQFTRSWKLSTGYRYRWEEEGAGDAESNAVFVGVTYNLPTWKIGD